MIHAVVGRTVFMFLDAVGNAQFTRQGLQGFMRAGHGDKIRAEIGHVILQALRGIAFRVDRNEQHLVSGPVGELHVQLRQVVKRAGAYIRAVGEAEKHQRPFALQTIQAKGFTVLVKQLECRYFARFGQYQQGSLLRRLFLLRGLPQGETGACTQYGDQYEGQVDVFCIAQKRFSCSFHGSFPAPARLYCVIRRDVPCVTGKTMTENLTLAEWIDHVAAQFAAAGLHYGHGTDNEQDEAAWLVLHAAGGALDGSFDDWGRLADEATAEKIEALSRLRRESGKPLAYLTGTAFFAGLAFEVNENVLVPRSPLAELILDGFRPWVKAAPPERVLDMCTGSGCIGIAAAVHTPGLRVDLADISRAALEVAHRNVQRHAVADRVTLFESDLFASLPPRAYDLVLANPPYVPAAAIAALPREYRAEPRLGLVSGDDGLDAPLAILLDAPRFLCEYGVLVCEVGESEDRLAALLPAVPFTWLEFEDGGSGVFVLTRDELLKAAPAVQAAMGKRNDVT